MTMVTCKSRVNHPVDTQIEYINRVNPPSLFYSKLKVLLEIHFIELDRRIAHLKALEKKKSRKTGSGKFRSERYTEEDFVAIWGNNKQAMIPSFRQDF